MGRLLVRILKRVMGHLLATDPSIDTVTPLADTSSAGTQNAGSACAVALWIVDAGGSLCRVTRAVMDRDVRGGSSAQK
jgi:hypothetical protein